MASNTGLGNAAILSLRSSKPLGMERHILGQFTDWALPLFMPLGPVLIGAIVSKKKIILSFQFSCFTSCIVFNCSWESVYGLCQGKSVEFQYFYHSAWDRRTAEVSRVPTMSAELYWQHPASVPSLSPALMGFRSITMKRRSAVKTASANPLWILIRTDAF